MKGFFIKGFRFFKGEGERIHDRGGDAGSKGDFR
jgi:hypothetical protein